LSHQRNRAILRQRVYRTLLENGRERGWGPHVGLVVHEHLRLERRALLPEWIRCELGPGIRNGSVSNQRRDPLDGGEQDWLGRRHQYGRPQFPIHPLWALL